MRWANVIAFWVGSVWLGGCVALFAGAARVFALAKDQAIDSSSQQVGEVFGEMFALWTWFGLVALGVLVLSRVVAWGLHARRHRFGLAQVATFLLLAVLIVSTLATARATFAAGEAYQQWESVEEGEAKVAAYAAFSAAHVASRKRGEGMVLALFLVVVGVGIGLARREPQGTSAPASLA